MALCNTYIAIELILLFQRNYDERYHVGLVKLRLIFSVKISSQVGTHELPIIRTFVVGTDLKFIPSRRQLQSEQMSSENKMASCRTEIRSASLDGIDPTQHVSEFVAHPDCDFMRLTAAQSRTFGMDHSTILTSKRRILATLAWHLPSFRIENASLCNLSTIAELQFLWQLVINKAHDCHPWFNEVPDELFVIILLQVPVEVKQWDMESMQLRIEHMLYPGESIEMITTAFLSMDSICIESYYNRRPFVFHRWWALDPSPSMARELENNGYQNQYRRHDVIPYD